MAINDITGDRIASRPNSKAFEDNFDKIFKKDKAVYTWIKHPGGIDCHVDKNAKVMIETWTTKDRIYKAGDVNWLAVKWYRVIDEKK